MKNITRRERVKTCLEFILKNNCEKRVELFFKLVLASIFACGNARVAFKEMIKVINVVKTQKRSDCNRRFHGILQ